MLRLFLLPAVLPPPESAQNTHDVQLHRRQPEVVIIDRRVGRKTRVAHISTRTVSGLVAAVDFRSAPFSVVVISTRRRPERRNYRK